MLLDMETVEHRHMASHGEPLPFNESNGHASDEGIDGYFFQITLVGANASAKPVVNMPLTGHHNYFLGNDICRWASHALLSHPLNIRKTFRHV